MKTSEDLACRAAHLVGLAGDFIDWSKLEDEEFRHLMELVDVSKPEMSDALFEALSRLLQGEGMLSHVADQDLTAEPTVDPIYGTPEPSEAPGRRSLSPARLFSSASLRVIRGGRT